MTNPSAVHIGRYEIIERIGVGGMAEVFRAVARGPGGYRRELIIKRILPHLAENEEFIRSFIDEAKILGMLNHPNIVGVYDFGQADGRHYLALEYLDGPSVSQLFAYHRRTAQPMPAAIAAHIAREVCRGLEAVHTLRDPHGRPLQVVHRDVTPSNVMTKRGGAVKLLDFGIAKHSNSDQVTRSGQIKGKSGYFAPEQIRGEVIDGRVDLFALGVVLHEMLVSRYLFYGEGGEVAAIYRIMEMPIPTPSSVRADVPPALDAIVMKALARQPEDRYQSAAEMGADLEALLDALGMRSNEMERFVASVPAIPDRPTAAPPPA